MSSVKKMSPAEKHYWELSEVYLSAYQDNVEPNIKIMQAMGVIVEMESDLVVFEKTKGQTEKSKAQIDRLSILKSSIDAFTIVSQRNLQFNMVMTNLYRDNESKSLKIAELENEIIKLNKNLEGL